MNKYRRENQTYSTYTDARVIYLLLNYKGIKTGKLWTCFFIFLFSNWILIVI